MHCLKKERWTISISPSLDYTPPEADLTGTTSPHPTNEHHVARMLLACGAHMSLVFGAFYGALPNVLLSDQREL